MDKTTGKTHLKIGIIDADLIDGGTRHPNLALMKISGYCKGLEHEARLLFEESDLQHLDNFDVIVISKVFSFTKDHPAVENVIGTTVETTEKFNRCVYSEIRSASGTKGGEKRPMVLIGGTGYFEDGGLNLHRVIEHHAPDYSLYTDYIDAQVASGKKRSYYTDYEDYSIGFTTRGCFRKCEFCVNKKFNRAELHSPIEEFLDKDRKKIYLWDDNFFALFDGWETILKQLQKTGKPFQFRQGLDIRLMEDRHMELLSQSKYNGDFIFAFDFIKDEELIEKKLEMWRKYTKRGTKLYVLCGFEPKRQWDGVSDIELLYQEDIRDTFRRIRILMRYGCLPYIMRHENYRGSRYENMYVQLARWCNQPQFFKKMSFREFCEANQKYHANENTLCKTYETMLTFEKDRKDIADEFFDLKFENERSW